jgi:hypothetical protein
MGRLQYHSWWLISALSLELDEWRWNDAQKRCDLEDCFDASHDVQRVRGSGACKV